MNWRSRCSAPLYYLERALPPFAELAKTEDANLLTADRER